MMQRYPVWLWPNLLSLDAPAVAVAWYVLLAHSRQVAVDIAAAVVLAVTVWSIYVVDRVLDARGSPPATPRHRFAGNHAWGLLVPAAIAAATVACASPYILPASTVVHGLIVALAVAVYLFGVHQTDAAGARVKELVMPALFAAGVMVPLTRPAAVAPEWAATTLVAWINVNSIDAWEAGERSGSARWAGVPAGVALLLLAGRNDYYGALALSAFLLFTLDGLRGRMSPSMLRVAADLALLAPALLLRLR